ncbi:hypothetical protein PAEPH01_0850 [Pancytospora epiphaga]|nr:hypothetical protein PAEPH01_0850 [Pancytospora epiphaga]
MPRRKKCTDKFSSKIITKRKSCISHLLHSKMEVAPSIKRSQKQLPCLERSGVIGREAVTNIRHASEIDYEEINVSLENAWIKPETRRVGPSSNNGEMFRDVNGDLILTIKLGNRVQEKTQRRTNMTQKLCIKCMGYTSRNHLSCLKVPQFEIGTFTFLPDVISEEQSTTSPEINENFVEIDEFMEGTHSWEQAQLTEEESVVVIDEIISSQPQCVDIKVDDGHNSFTEGLSCFYEDLLVKQSNIHGLGLFTTVKIPNGTFLMSYEGERIGKCLSDKREKIYLRNNIKSVYMFKITEDLIVDATFVGNKARYINQSCAPNCYTWTNDGRISYYSWRDIEPGEELVIDYHFDDVRVNETCLCGASNCRSKI